MLPPWIGGHIADGGQKAGDEGGGEEEAEPDEEEVPEANPFYGVYRYYASDRGTDKIVTSEEVNEKNENFKTKMEELKAIVARLEKPDGSQEYPARTCRDLNVFYPEKPSGMYWLDPNKGCKSDAIQVHCDFSDVSKVITCVKPEKEIQKDNWHSRMSNTASRKWFNQDHNLDKITYSADKSQLTYLGYLHAGATQNVTVHCHNFIAWMNADRGNLKHAMEFMGGKHTKFGPWGEDRYKPEVVLDECKHVDLKNPTWKKTVLKFKTHKFVRLPIIDFMPHNVVDRSAQFGMEMGPVCFY